MLNGGVGIGNLAVTVPQAGNDAMAGQTGECQRGDELLRCRRHHDMHIERLLLQRPHQFCCFIGSNSSGNADRDLHGLIVTRAFGCLPNSVEGSDTADYVCRIGV